MKELGINEKKLLENPKDQAQLVEKLKSTWTNGFDENACPFILLLISFACQEQNIKKIAKETKFRYSDAIEEFLRENPNQDFRITDPDGRGIFHYIGLYANVRLFDFLTQRDPETNQFKYNIDLNKLDSFGSTPLMVAVLEAEENGKKHIELIKKMLALEECDPNIRNNKLTTAFHFACVKPNYRKDDILDLFLNNERVEKTAQDENGMTALMFLLQEFPYTRSKLNKILENSKPGHFLLKDSSDSDALAIAISNQNMTTEYLEKIIEKSGIDITSYTKKGGYTPLMLASIVANKETIEFFIDKGNALNDRSNDSQETPLMVYLTEKLYAKGDKDTSKKELLNLEIINLLLGDSSLNIVNIANNGNERPLHLLMRFEKLNQKIKQRCLNLFLEFQADPNQSSIFKGEFLYYTPLMHAIRNKDKESVKKLLPLSDLRLRDGKGNTYLILAAEYYDSDIYSEVLREYQKNIPYDLEIENNEGKTYEDCFPPDVKAQRNLLKEIIEEEQEAKSARIKRAVQLAKEIKQLEKEEQQAELAPVAVSEAAKAPDTAKAASAADVEQQKFFIRKTKKLKQWNGLSRIKNYEDRIASAQEIIKKDGYLEDPTKEPDPIRRSRAQLYQGLRAAGKAPEEAVDRIILGHALPTFITQIVLQKQLPGKPLGQFIIKDIPFIRSLFRISRWYSPQILRLSDLDISYIIRDVDNMDNEKILKKEIKNIEIGKMPIMVKSSICTLNIFKDNVAKIKKECPRDCGGYFIIKGSEKIVLAQERSAENNICCYYGKNSS
ncbi:MAG: hypothetical protein EBU90_15430, partial [Proteobacteria bacterium]|nr:hypothetical protein [Pseudomonadota bacterium]